MTASQGMVWDACTIINLAATNRAVEILDAFGVPSYIVREVRVGEVFSLRPLPEDNSSESAVRIDLTTFIAAGALQEVVLTAEELATFISFAESVDDGEARSLAVALHRGLMLVTDDKECIRLASGLSPQVPIIMTPDWVKEWADGIDSGGEVIADVLRRIEICAHYRPRRTHPHKEWWERNVAR